MMRRRRRTGPELSKLRSATPSDQLRATLSRLLSGRTHAKMMSSSAWRDSMIVSAPRKMSSLTYLVGRRSKSQSSCIA